MVDQDKRTVASAHSRIDSIEKQLIELQTTVDLQFRDLFNRVKRLGNGISCHFRIYHCPTLTHDVGGLVCGIAQGQYCTCWERSNSDL